MNPNPQERVIVIIDGGNTYRTLFKERKDREGNLLPPPIKKGRRFDYKKFAEYLSNGRVLVDVRYYVGIVRNTDHTEKSQKMVSSQQKLLQGLEDVGILIERGRLVYDHVTREKGVDVKMAIDIAVRACEDEYDTAILISSDSDLLPAIKLASSKGKRVEYIGFENRHSVALLDQCSSGRILGNQELEQFVRYTPSLFKATEELDL